MRRTGPALRPRHARCSARYSAGHGTPPGRRRDIHAPAPVPSQNAVVTGFRGAAIFAAPSSPYWHGQPPVPPGCTGYRRALWRPQPPQRRFVPPPPTGQSGHCETAHRRPGSRHSQLQSPASNIESSPASQRLNTSRNFCILRSCSHVARFIDSPLAGAQNRTTRVLPNPDNSCAYDRRRGATLRGRVCQARPLADNVPLSMSLPGLTGRRMG